ncbi:MAG: hypothetical protein MHM6MM_006636 [Cercozoa sp. M6MM]
MLTTGTCPASFPRIRYCDTGGNSDRRLRCRKHAPILFILPVIDVRSSSTFLVDGVLAVKDSPCLFLSVRCGMANVARNMADLADRMAELVQNKLDQMTEPAETLKLARAWTDMLLTAFDAEAAAGPLVRLSNLNLDQLHGLATYRQQHVLPALVKVAERCQSVDQDSEKLMLVLDELNRLLANNVAGAANFDQKVAKVWGEWAKHFRLEWGHWDKVDELEEADVWRLLVAVEWMAVPRPAGSICIRLKTRPNGCFTF